MSTRQPGRASQSTPEPWHRKFQALMPFRIREILLVSSGYDAFVLEEDGSLTDRLFYEYSELSLSWAPRLTHAPTVSQGLALLEERRFDLVITVVEVSDGDATELSRRIKARHEDMPVVLLIFDEADLEHFPDGRPSREVDRTFLWTGNASSLIAVIKLIEDQRNVEHDTRAAGVQVILVVEDRTRNYSSFLALLYAELLTQAGSLIDEGLNDLHRLMRMRARPKIVLATDVEEGASLIFEHRAFLCSLMTDLSIPRNGVMAADGGLELMRLARENDPDLPILVQSAEPDAKETCSAYTDWCVGKNAADFRGEVRAFLQEALGFGDFVFRLPDRTEVARVRDVYEMEEQLKRVPAEVIAYHARRNHFSMWLRARSMFPLAARIRPKTVDDFADVEELRASLVSALRNARTSEQEGVITDLSARQTGPENRFVRIGRGSIGGKGRGIAFISTQIVRHGLLERFDDLQIRIPKTVVLGTDGYDEFMEPLDPAELATLPDDGAITGRLLTHEFPELLRAKLLRAFRRLKGPIVVRSSSLLEDSRFRPFAGVYASFVLPNTEADEQRRFEALEQAIKGVYASTLWRGARSYLAGTPFDPGDQKMAVVIQQAIGQHFGDRFYPALAGVAQSFNYYPVGGQRAADGIAHIALGFGHTVVMGGVALRFSPGAPTVLPQFPDAESFLDGSQREFYALDLSRTGFDPRQGPEASLSRESVARAERDGVLSLVGSVYSVADDVIRENLTLPGPRLITFNNVLKWNAIPLAAALRDVLALLREGVGSEVEIEFALDVPDLETGGPMSGNRVPRLFLLQLRPISSPDRGAVQRAIGPVRPQDVLCQTDIAMGDMFSRDIQDIVLVTADRLDPGRGRDLVRHLRELNERLASEGRKYVLVGPGRWGSRDPSLGVGVSWSDIAGATVIVETPIGNRRVEPSQGTHFFRNITAAKVGYLTVERREGSELDEAWLHAHPDGEVAAAPDGCTVRHVRVHAPLSVFVDGRRGVATILKPRAEDQQMAAKTETV